MQRVLLAVAAAALTIAGLVMLFFDGATYSAAASACLRSGLVLGALALALPQVLRLLEVAPPWFLASAAVGLILIFRWPRSVAIVLPLLIALWFLGPRSKSSGKRSPPRKKTAVR